LSPSSYPKLCVLGLGYIGLPTSSILAARGFEVLGVDIDARVLETLESGEVHLEEPGLATMVQGAIASGRLRFSQKPEPADAYFVTVPTPRVEGEGGGMDDRFVRAAVESILPVLRAGNLVVLESTVAPGTSRDIVIPLLEGAGFRVGEDLFYAYCPERVLPGRILVEFLTNARIIGADDPESLARAETIYSEVVEGGIHRTTCAAAELCKLLENTYRDVNIALANEAAWLCEELGADFEEVRALANRHPRVSLLRPGPGVGGHCISVDPTFLIAAAPELATLVRTARETNAAQPARVVGRALGLVAGAEAPRIGVLGVAYKADVGDVRETPATAVLAGLAEAGVEVRAHDPHVPDFSSPLVSLEEAAEGADCLVVLTDHAEFRELDPASLRELVREPVVYDTRGSLDEDRWREAGFRVVRLGAGG
jgi:UDP-N-acetyl-D-mannosaminuronic acid dehydrogenase